MEQRMEKNMESANIKKTLSSYRNSQTVQKLSESFENGAFIDAEELAECYATAENIHKVCIHCHKPTLLLDIGKLDSLADLTDDEKNYIKKSASSLKFNLLPKADKALNNLFSTMRMKLRELSIGRSDLMELQSFTEEWLPYMKEKLVVLEQIKEDIISDYDESKAIFEENVLSICAKICPDRINQVMRSVKTIAGRSADDIVKNISINLETDFGANQMSTEEFANFLKACKKEFFIKTGVDVIKGHIEELWELVNRYLTSIQDAKSEDLSGWVEKKNNLEKKRKKIMRENVCNLPVIQKACEGLRKIANANFKAEAEEYCIRTLAELYCEVKAITYGNEVYMGNMFTTNLTWVTEKLLEDVYNEMQDE